MQNKLRALAVVGIAFAATSALSACNTVEGFGRDVGYAGNKLEQAGNSWYNEDGYQDGYND